MQSNKNNLFSNEIVIFSTKVINNLTNIFNDFLSLLKLSDSNSIEQQENLKKFRNKKLENLFEKENEYLELKEENEELEKTVSAMLNVIDFSTQEQMFMEDTILALERLMEYSRQQAIDKDKEIKARQAVLELANIELKELDKEINAYSSIMDLAGIEKMEKDKFSDIFKKQRDRLNDLLRQLLLQKRISTFVNSTLDLNSIIDFTFQKLIEIFDFKKILFQTVDNENNTIKFENIYGMKAKDSETDNKNNIFPFNPDEIGLSTTIMHYNSVHFFNEKKSTNKIPSTIMGFIYLCKDNEYFCPILFQNETIALIQFSFSGTEKKLSRQELAILNSILVLITPAIKNAMLHKSLIQTNEELNNKNKIIAEDMDIAKKMIDSMMEINCKKFKGLDFYLYFKPIFDIGGDFIDIEKKNENVTRIILADAVGHGIQAALVTMLFKSEYERIKFHYDNPSDTLKALSINFHNKYRDLMLFFTCALLDIDLASRTVRIAFAGHPPQLLLHDGKLEELACNGYMIGFSQKGNYPMIEKKISLNDKLILFTDGLYDEFSKNGEIFGYEKLIEFYSKFAENTVKTLGDKSVKEISSWMKDTPQFDDMTLLIIGVKELPEKKYSIMSNYKE